MEFIPIIIVLGILLSEVFRRNQNNKTPFWLAINKILGLDIRAIALFRICLGLNVLYDLIDRFGDLTEHYTDAGVMPRFVLENVFPFNSFPYIYMLTGSTVGITIIFIINMLLAVFLVFGLYTRFVTPILWYFIISLQYRNMLICFGGDLFLHTLLFWGMFLPLGDKWSIDSLLIKDELKQNDSKQVLSFATAAYIFQIVILYVISTEFKYSQEWRKEGTAIYYALIYDLYLRPFGKFILDLHIDNIFKYLTFYVYWLERAGLFLLFSPFHTNLIRLILILLYVSMHIGISLCMNVGYFGIVSIVAMIPLLPGVYIDKFYEKFKTQLEEIKTKYISPYLNLIKVRFGNKVKELDTVPLELKNILIFLLLSYTLFQNIASAYPYKYSLPKEISNLGTIFFLEQRWAMFIISNLKLNWWVVMPGDLEDGSQVDIKCGKKVEWKKPDIVLDTVKSFRASNYLNNVILHESAWDINFLNYGNFLCHDWNRTHPKEKHLKKFDVFYVFEENLPEYRSRPHQKRLVWKQYCNTTKEDKEKMWSAINSTVDVTSEKCDLDKAIVQLKENLKYLDERLGSNNPASMKCLLKLAECYRTIKNYAESEKIYKKMIYISEKTYGEDQIFTYSLYFYLTSVLGSEGKRDEQKEVHRIAIDNLKRISGENYEATIYSAHNFRKSLIGESCSKKYK